MNRFCKSLLGRSLFGRNFWHAFGTMESPIDGGCIAWFVRDERRSGGKLAAVARGGARWRERRNQFACRVRTGEERSLEASTPGSRRLDARRLGRQHLSDHR